MEIFSIALILTFSFRLCFTSDMKEDISEAITDSKRRLHFDDNRRWYNFRRPTIIKWVPVQAQTERGGEGQAEYDDSKSSPASSESRGYDRESNQYPRKTKQYEVEGEQSQRWNKHSRGKYGYDDVGDGKSYNEPKTDKYSWHDSRDSSSPDHERKWQKYDDHKHSYGNDHSGEEDYKSHKGNNHDDKESDHSSGPNYNHNYYRDDEKHKDNYEHDSHQKDGKDHDYGYKGQNDYGNSDDFKNKHRDSTYGSDGRDYYESEHGQQKPSKSQYSHSQQSDSDEKNDSKQESEKNQDNHENQNIAHSNAIQQSGSYPLPSDMRWWQGWAQGWHQAVKSI